LRGSGRFASTVSRADDVVLVSIPFIAGQWSLRAGNHDGRNIFSSVSIPFIAGQWSLRGVCPYQAYESPAFQSPSLRGSGRFPPLPSLPEIPLGMFQSPSLRGSGRFRTVGVYQALFWGLFQSPSLRGSGRFGTSRVIDCFDLVEFQSPSLRGSGRFPEALQQRLGITLEFQSPSLRGSGRFFFARHFIYPASFSFNPLHCGAVVASRCWWCVTILVN